MKKKLYYGLGIGILLACQMGVNSYAGFWTDVTDHALEHVEHTDIVEQADGYVLLENTKKGFASSDTEYGIYDVVNQEWKIAYQGYEDADAENAKYVGDGIFAFQESGADQDDMEQNVILLNAKSGEVTYAAIPKMSLDHLNFKNGYSISIGETDVWDVFVIGENGEYYPTGIRNRCQDSESSWDLDEYYTDGQYAVYTDDRSDFIIYDRDKDEISDFYNPVYAEKIVHTFSQDVDPEVYICDKYLVLTNMLGEDRQYYYTVLTFDGTEYIEPTMCDYATVTEWGNLLVENGDQIEEIKLTDKSRDVAQPVSQLVMTSFEEGSRENEELAMDRKGQAYKNTVEYRYQLLKSGPYDLGDTWYLGGNYETFQGVWYCPYNTGKDVMVTVRLLGDEQVLYESPVINAQNCRQEFEVNVSGVQQLRLEYSGTAGTNDILFGLSDGEFLPAGVSGTVPEKKEETVEAAQDVMLPDTAEELTYAGKWHEIFYQNGYAALKELESYMSIGFNRERKEVIASAVPIENVTIDWKNMLFDYSVLVSGGYKKAVSMIAETVVASVETNSMSLNGCLYGNLALARQMALSQAEMCENGALKRDACPEDSHQYCGIGYACADIPEKIVIPNVVGKVCRRMYANTDGGAVFCSGERKLTKLEFRDALNILFSGGNNQIPGENVLLRRIDDRLRDLSVLPQNLNVLTYVDVVENRIEEWEAAFGVPAIVKRGRKDIEEYITTLYEEFTFRAGRVMVKYGPRAMENLYYGAGSDDPTECADSSIRQIMEEVKEYLLSNVHTQPEHPEPLPEMGRISMVLNGRRKVDAWKIAKEDAIQADIRMEIARAMCGGNGIWIEEYQNKVEHFIQNCSHFADVLESMTEYYETVGKSLDASDFTEFAMEMGSNEVNLCSDQKTYEWIKNVFYRK